MKIQCDVCTKKEALVFCCADEAALCHGCDQRVHHANKLASKHQRFSLLHPPPSLAPLCDICQEKRALLFCQEDRAILCRDCELPLHSGNEHTQKHNRYLLTGIKLSGVCNLGGFGSDPVPNFEPTSEISSSEPVFSNSGNTITVDSVDDKVVSGGPTSSISEYLIETLPGWHFEDFDDASLSFSKSGSMNEFEVDKDVLSFWDGDIDNKKMSSYCCTNNTSIQSENLGIWVPQAPMAASLYHQNQSGLIVQGGLGLMKKQETSVNNGFKVNNKKWRRENNNALTVPQNTHFDGSSKRPRTLW